MNKTIIFSLLAVLLLAACGGPGATPTPSGSPGPTPSGSPSGSPGQTPTPTVTLGPDAIAHPTGSSDIVLQMEQGGGIVPMGFFVTQAPSFSLYGDGTVIVRPTDTTERALPLGGLPAFWQADLDEEIVQALLRFALGQGRLLDAREHYPPNSCADCGSTIFKLNAAGLVKTVTVDALGMVEGQPDAVDRAGFLALAETLAGFEARMLATELGEVLTYDPALYRVVLVEAQQGQGDPIDWPWTDVTLAGFTPEEGGYRQVAVLTREQVALITEVPSGGQESIFIEDAEGKLWTAGVRPLLPDEIAAATEG